MSAPSLVWSITEEALQRAVVEEAQLRGWAVYHTYDSRRSSPGFPDLIMLRGPRLIAAELKAARGQPTQAQIDWLDRFAQVTEVESYLWNPTDRADGNVTAALLRREANNGK